MQDIRKPYSRSKSNRGQEIRKRVEEFETHHYEDSPAQSGEELYDEDPVQIPIKKSFKERRNIDKMEMFPSRGRRAYDKGEETYGRRESDDIVYHDPRTRYEKKRQSLGTLAFIAALLLLVVGGGLLTFVFNRATVTIVPKHEDLVDFRKTIMFATPAADTANTISFVVATTSLAKEKTLPLSETKRVEAKASGKIIIYNNYSGESQRLIKNTRFESSTGKIYRINQSVEVPGKSGSTPGSVEVTVYADGFGAEYNSAPDDFTIPGFRGTPQYTGFYARSNGPITGGASGTASLAALSDINAAKDELAIELAQDIKKALGKEKKEGHVGLYSAIDVVYEDNEAALLRGETSTYRVTATGYLMFANASELAQSVAQSVRDYSGEAVRLDHTDRLTFTRKDTDRIKDMTSLEMLVEGSPRVVFLTDAEALKALVAGKKRSEFTSLMKGIPSIEGAEISFSPLWLSTFPVETSKINVIESLPKR
jgi:hypothetical protein